MSKEEILQKLDLKVDVSELSERLIGKLSVFEAIEIEE